MDYCTKDTVTSLKDQQEIASTFHVQAGSLLNFNFKETRHYKGVCICQIMLVCMMNLLVNSSEGGVWILFFSLNECSRWCVCICIFNKRPASFYQDVLLFSWLCHCVDLKLKIQNAAVTIPFHHFYHFHFIFKNSRYLGAISNVLLVHLYLPCNIVKDGNVLLRVTSLEQIVWKQNQRENPELGVRLCDGLLHIKHSSSLTKCQSGTTPGLNGRRKRQWCDNEDSCQVSGHS